MFLLTPRDELQASYKEKFTKSEQKLKVINTTLEHLEAKSKEADSAFTEVVSSIRRKLGVEVSS